VNAICDGIAQGAVSPIEIAEASCWHSLRVCAHLVLTRAAICQAVIEPDGARRTAALAVGRRDVEVAIQANQKAQNQHETPRLFLARAWVRSVAGDADGARRDLDDAWQIVERGPMRLLRADIHLYRARLFHTMTPYPWDKDDQGKPRGPKDDLAAARKLIEQCGYWRRKEELEDAEEAAKSW